jgi:hypothetical protein
VQQATDEHEVQRLRRHLRALSAVNRQLHAQLEGATVPSVGGAGAHSTDLLGDSGTFGAVLTRARRVGTASAWLQQLQLRGGAGEVFLVRTPAAETYLVEDTVRREVKSGLLVAALTKLFGAPRAVGQSEVNHFSDGPPVEVLEGPSGPAFIVAGGRRYPIRGLPLPYPVGEEMNVFPLGDEINLSLGALGGGGRARSKLARATQAAARDGVVPTAKKAARAVRRRTGAG